MTQRKAVLVMGAGDATGGAIARRFAREGYVACVARRNAEKLEPLVQAIRDQGGEALACGCDARQEQQVIDLFARIEGEVGALEAVIFNVGANVWFPITETTERVYRKVWEMAAFGGFLDTDFIRETLPELYKRKEQDGILDPEHIAETYWQIHCQPRDCWVHELDLRPWMETF